jgi:HK97 family phage major capsid protein
MKRLLDVQQKRAAKQADMSAIFALCEKESRLRTAEERTKWDGLAAEVAELDAEIDALKKQQEIDNRSAKPVGDVVETRTETFDEERIPSVRSQVYSWFKKNKSGIDDFIRTGDLRSLPRLELRVVDNPMTTATVNSGSSAFLPNAGGIQGSVIDLVRTQPTFWDLLPKGRTSLNPYVWAYKYNKEGNADFIGEGVLKPIASFEIRTETSVAKKVAERMRVSRELLKDMVGFATMVENELRYEVKKHANDASLTGTVSSTDPAGVTTVAGAFTLTGLEVSEPNNYDAVRAAVAQLASLNFTSNIVAFVNPVDAAQMDMEKGSDGHYALPPFYTAGGQQISGVRIVSDNNIPKGFLLIGSMDTYKILMVEEFFIEWGLDSDDFSKNLITVIGEMRFHQFFPTNYTGSWIYDAFADIKTAIYTT